MYRPAAPTASAGTSSCSCNSTSTAPSGSRPAGQQACEAVTSVAFCSGEPDGSRRWLGVDHGAPSDLLSRHGAGPSCPAAAAQSAVGPRGGMAVNGWRSIDGARQAAVTGARKAAPRTRKDEAVMTELLHRAGDPWADLTTGLLTEVASGRPAMWVSFSGTSQVFVTRDGAVTRTRQGVRASRHPGDGWPLLVQPRSSRRRAGVVMALAIGRHRRCLSL